MNNISARIATSPLYSATLEKLGHSVSVFPRFDKDSAFGGVENVIAADYAAACNFDFCECVATLAEDKECRVVLFACEAEIEAYLNAPRIVALGTAAADIAALVIEVVKSKLATNTKIRDAVIKLLAALDPLTSARLGRVVALALGVSSTNVKKAVDSHFQAAPSPRNLIELNGRHVRIVPGESIELVDVSPSGGEAITKLAGFTAQIDEQIIVNKPDGAVVEYAISGHSPTGPLPLVRIPSERFADLKWISQYWGVDAFLYPLTPAQRDILRGAIEKSSVNCKKSEVRTSLGWEIIDGERVYVHAGGGISASGPIELRVETDSRLSHAVLPAPATNNRVSTIEAFIRVAPPEITVPLLASVFRAPLLGFVRPVDCVFILGETGSKKSTLATLMQQFFGPAFGGPRGLCQAPACFEDTANSISLRANRFGDAIILVDDLAPSACEKKAKQHFVTLENLARNAANCSARGRMSADCESTRKDLQVRGLLVFTGEDISGSDGIQGRILTVEINRRTIDVPALTTAQSMACAGEFAALMADFIMWLAQNGPVGQPDFVKVPGHIRAPLMAGNLVWGLENMVQWLVARGEIDVNGGRSMLATLKKPLLAAAQSNGGKANNVPPGEKFLELIRAGLAADAIAIPSRNEDTAEIRVPIVGFTDDRDGMTYLFPPLAVSEAAKLSTQGAKYTFSVRTTGRNLDTERFLAAKDTQRGTLTVRKSFNGTQTNCWAIESSIMLGNETVAVEVSPELVEPEPPISERPDYPDAYF